MKKTFIIAFIILSIIALAVIIFGYFQYNDKYVINNDRFTNADIHYGCYWGDTTSKKSGTPDNWVLVNSGTQSSQWCDPRSTSTSLSSRIYTDISVSDATYTDLIGFWASSIDGEEIMSFYVGDNDNLMYASYSHGTPFVSGTWSLIKGQLVVNFTSDIEPKRMTFVSVSRKGNKLILKSAEGEESVHELVE